MTARLQHAHSGMPVMEDAKHLVGQQRQQQKAWGLHACFVVLHAVPAA